MSDLSMTGFDAAEFTTLLTQKLEELVPSMVDQILNTLHPKKESQEPALVAVPENQATDPPLESSSSSAHGAVSASNPPPQQPAPKSCTDQEQPEVPIPEPTRTRRKKSKKSKSGKRKADDSTFASPVPLRSVPFDVQSRPKKVYNGPFPQCSICTHHHPLGSQCWICANCGRFGHLAHMCVVKDHQNQDTAPGKSLSPTYLVYLFLYQADSSVSVLPSRFLRPLS